MSAAVAASRAEERREFTIMLLNKIFPFAAENAAQALHQLGLVCKQWRETVLFHAAEMWKTLILLKWPAAHVPLRGRLSFQAFERRYKTGLQRAADFAEIENCGEPEYAFRCPIVLANMRRTSDTTFFCDICDRSVFIVDVNDKKAQDEAAAAERCVAFLAPLQRSALKAHNEKFPVPKRQMEADDHEGKAAAAASAAASGSSSSSTIPLPPPPPPMSPYGPQAVHYNLVVLSMDGGHAQPIDSDPAASFLRTLNCLLTEEMLATHTKFLSRDCYVATNYAPAGVQIDPSPSVPNKKKTRRATPRHGDLDFHAQVIKIPLGTSANSVRALCVDTPGAPLGRAEMPSVSGITFIVFADAGVAQLFGVYDSTIKEKLKGTIVGSLIAAGMYETVPATGDSPSQAVIGAPVDEICKRIAEVVLVRVISAGGPPPPPPPGGLMPPPPPPPPMPMPPPPPPPKSNVPPPGGK